MTTQYGTSGDDTLTGTAGADTIDGGVGNDTIYGGAGYDQLYGGAGDDELHGQTDGIYDDLYGGTGNDILYAGDDDDMWLYGGDDQDTLYGGSGTDLLSGDAGDDMFYGGYGNDTVYGGGGDDIIQAQWGDDTVFGGTGDDHIYMSNEAGDDTLYGGADYDTVTFVSATDVTITAGSGGTFSYSQLGGDTQGTFTEIEAIQTGGGADSLDLSLSTQAMTVTLNDGADEVFGGSGAETIFGGAGTDSLFGGGGADVIYGGADADTIAGGAGHDSLFGGAGNDTLSGGGGDDVFGVSQAGGDDVITDFDIGDTDGDGAFNDQLDVSDLQNPDGSPVRPGDVTVVDDGTGNAKLIFPEGESVVLQGVAPAAISAPSELHSAGIPCFTPGALIATEHGERAVEDLHVGDRVFTRDHGLQTIRWVGQRLVQADADRAPIVIDPSVVHGMTAPLRVSPQHRMLFQGYRAQLLFGESEVFVSAKHLVDGMAVRQDPGGWVMYIHLMFDCHEVIFANGAPTESFHPGEEGIAGVDPAAREELFAIFPELRADLSTFGQTARRCLRQFETEQLRR